MIGLWLVLYFFLMILNVYVFKLSIDVSILIAIVISTLVTFVVKMARDIFMLQRLERRHQDENRRRPEDGGPQRREKERQPEIQLEDLQLIIKNNEKQLRLGLLVNPTKDEAIKPIAVININDPKWTRQWPNDRPIIFQIITPRHHRIAFEEKTIPQFRMGENRVYPKESLQIKPQGEIGSYPFQNNRWTVKVLVGQKIWQETEFLVTENEADLMKQHIGSDMEMTRESQMLAEELKGTTNIDDILM